MNTQTGEIKLSEKLTKVEVKSGVWVELTEKQAEILQRMNRKQRRQLLKNNKLHSKGPWGFFNGKL